MNNSFLIQTKHAYFQDIGGNSLQEIRSAKYVLQLLDKHRILVTSDEMNDVQRNEIQNARNIIEQSILWTDIKRHKEQMEAVALAKEYIKFTESKKIDSSTRGNCRSRENRHESGT